MPEYRPLPPLELLQQLLSYDPETGDLRWIGRGKGIRSGAIAGSVGSRGYRTIRVNHHRYKAHRLAWLMHHGADPGELQVDHRDCNPANNRISNLRLASPEQNIHNSQLSRSNKSGVKGVCWATRKRKWKASLEAWGVVHHLGWFTHLQDAIDAVTEARLRLHKDFARL